MPNPLAPPLRHLRRIVRRTAAAAGWHARPGFLIVGAQKAGTNALYAYLQRHPRLIGSAAKETYFFSPESFDGWTDNPDYPFFRRLKREGFEPTLKPWAARWYHSQFPLPRPGRPAIPFEATPDYFYMPLSPGRIHAYRPAMKLIVLLRDPIERAYSAWNMFRGFEDGIYRQLRDDRSFEQAVSDEMAGLGRVPLAVGTDYVRRGLYENQLRRYLDYFPGNQILVVENRELRANTAATLQEICAFLQVPPFADGLDWPPVGVGRYASDMDPSTRALLAEFYAPHNEALFELLGRRYDWIK